MGRLCCFLVTMKLIPQSVHSIQLGLRLPKQSSLNASLNRHEMTKPFRLLCLLRLILLTPCSVLENITQSRKKDVPLLGGNSMEVVAA